VSGTTQEPSGTGGAGRPLVVELLDDAPLVACGLAEMLRPFRDRVELAAGDPAGTPDLVVHDPFLRPPHPPDEEVRRRLRRQSRWVAWTWAAHRRVTRERFGTPPLAYLFKGATAERLVEDLLRVRAGGLSEAPAPEKPAELWPGERHGLTQRQSDVVAAIARGLSNREIADLLNVTPNTVKTYIRAAYKAIGVRTRPQAVLWAVDHGLR
jgi:DNA-binding NarL/FixJ family response regulator